MFNKMKIMLQRGAEEEFWHSAPPSQEGAPQGKAKRTLALFAAVPETSDLSPFQKDSAFPT